MIIATLPIQHDGQRVLAELRTATTWADVVASLPWLLEDALVDALEPEDTVTRLYVRKPRPAAARAASQSPTSDNERKRTHSAVSDDAPAGSKDDDDDEEWPEPSAASPPPAPAAPLRPKCFAPTSARVYLLGLDIEQYCVRFENKSLPDAVRHHPSAMQLASRSRVLNIPIYDLTVTRGEPVPPELQLLFARRDVIFSGVGLKGDTKSLTALSLAFDPDRMLDANRVIHKWNTTGGLEDLMYAFSGMWDEYTRLRLAGRGVPDDLLPRFDDSGVRLAVGTAASLTYHRRRVIGLDSCANCKRHYHQLPAFTYATNDLLGIGDGPAYPQLAVGWKATGVAMSNWDLPAASWTQVMVLYAAIDALASREIGRLLRPVLEPANWVEGMPTLEFNPLYRPVHRRVLGGDLLEHIRRVLAHCLAQRGKQTVDKAAKFIDMWKLLRGFRNRPQVLKAAVEHLAAVGVVKLEPRAPGTPLYTAAHHQQQKQGSAAAAGKGGNGGNRSGSATPKGNNNNNRSGSATPISGATTPTTAPAPATPSASASAPEAKTPPPPPMLIAHVCLSKRIPPLRLPSPLPPLPADLTTTLTLSVPRIPGIEPTRATVLEYLVDYHPALILYERALAARIANAWLVELGDDGLEQVLHELRNALADVVRTLRSTVAAAVGGTGEGAKKKKARKSKNRRETMGLLLDGTVQHLDEEAGAHPVEEQVSAPDAAMEDVQE
ncbi:hypothetical protein H9P43_007693 [Blastocladiella emersonii ATCC 22665]|nr:hypothetical protein H9P43_007693 [Blastocladiella emersonii ATCC 22665]